MEQHLIKIKIDFELNFKKIEDYFWINWTWIELKMELF